MVFWYFGISLFHKTSFFTFQNVVLYMNNPNTAKKLLYLCIVKRKGQIFTPTRGEKNSQAWEKVTPNLTFPEGKEKQNENN